MSKLMQQPDGSWTATRRVGSRTVSLFVREIGHGYFGCTAVHGSFGTDLADTIGASRKVAIDRALAIAKRQLAMPSAADFAAALGPCNK